MKILLLLTLLISLPNLFVYAQSDMEEEDNDLSANCHIDLPDIFEPNVEEGRIMEVEVRDVHSFDIKIYNHWGKKVLESIMELPDSHITTNQKIKLLENGMDDVHYNKELESGHYQFTIDAVCNDGSFLRHNGTIELIRTDHK